MNKFNIVEEYKEKGINIPKRSTKYSAGYDIESAVEIVVPSHLKLIKNEIDLDTDILFSIEEVQKLIKKIELKPVMIPTGLNIELDDDKVLKLYTRSSVGIKSLLNLPNSVGIIDSDFYPNQFYFSFINLSPYDIIIKKGEKIGQGIIEKYYKVDDEEEIETTRKGGFGSTNQ